MSVRGSSSYAASSDAHGSGLASGYAVLTGLMLAAALGWPYVAGYALAVGLWLGWRHVRRTA